MYSDPGDDEEFYVLDYFHNSFHIHTRSVHITRDFTADSVTPPNKVIHRKLLSEKIVWNKLSKTKKVRQKNISCGKYYKKNYR
jgi:hypothetical protein